MIYPCPQCSTGIPVVEETAGKSVPCPGCAHSVKLPRLATAKLTTTAEKIDPDESTASEQSVNATVEVTLPSLDSGNLESTADTEKIASDEPLSMIEELGGDSNAFEEPSDEDDDDDIPEAVIEERKEAADSAVEKNGSASGVVVKRPPVARAKAKPARKQPLAKVVKNLRKEVIIPNAVDTLLPEQRLKPGEAVSPGNFTLTEPTAKSAKDLKVRPVLMKAAQAEASREFRGFKNKNEDSPVERISPDEAAPLQVRPRSKIGQLFGRARDFILADPKLRKGPAPDDARDHELKDQYRLLKPTERDATSVDVRPIAKRGHEEVSGFHDVMDRFVPLHEFEEMEGFGEMSKEEQEAILQAQAEAEQTRVSSTNKRMFFSGLVFAAPAVVAVTILGWHALQPQDPETPEIGGATLSGNAPAPLVHSASEAKLLAHKINSASTIEELAEFTRNPEASLPRMRRFYERVAFRPNRLMELYPGAGGEIDLPGQGFLWIMATTDEFGERRDRMLAFEKTREGLRLDWESYVNYSEVPWKDFVDQQHARSAEFRVTLEKDDYYNYAFSDEEKYLCYRLTDPENSRTCYGYALRVSKVASVLEGRLGLLQAQAEENLAPVYRGDAPVVEWPVEDKLPLERASIKVILSLRFPERTPDAGQAMIINVVCDGWVKP